MEGDIIMDDDFEEETPSWCKEFKGSWEEVPETNEEVRQQEKERREARRSKVAERQNEGSIRRGMNRHLIVIIDISKIRFDQLLSYIQDFIYDYFDQNPISQMGIIVTRNGIAEKLTELSGNASKHADSLLNIEEGGQPSLQNALHMAGVTMNVLPTYGSKEILIIYGSLSTCDPGDIYETIDKLSKSKIRVSVVGWGAEVYILRKIASETQGIYNVASNQAHFQELLHDHSPPPPTLINNVSISANLVCMGFPQKQPINALSFCLCHQELRKGGYTCPKCESKWCNLPADCTVCGLPLVASPHLARSYHHLFPLSSFSPNNIGNEMEDIFCFGCKENLSSILTNEDQTYYKCPRCSQYYCYDCDLFLHETLHNCPGCEMLSI